MKLKPLPLYFTQPLNVHGANKRQKYLCLAAHGALALNGFTALLGIVPIAGLLAAAGLISIARFGADGAGIPAINHTVARIVFGTVLLMIVIFSQIMLAESVKYPALMWLFVPLLQTPLALADLRAVYKGEAGFKLMKMERF